ncbi:hypothetical protein [Citrobacter sp. UYEF32]|uniref:hypothetical protein n=1 Tax=Citrobacter sp. UYEF32 TaxID=3156347 RepID=UPI0033934AB3
MVKVLKKILHVDPDKLLDILHPNIQLIGNIFDVECSTLSDNYINVVHQAFSFTITRNDVNDIINITGIKPVAGRMLIGSISNPNNNTLRDLCSSQLDITIYHSYCDKISTPENGRILLS